MKGGGKCSVRRDLGFSPRTRSRWEDSYRNRDQERFLKVPSGSSLRTWTLPAQALRAIANGVLSGSASGITDDQFANSAACDADGRESGACAGMSSLHPPSTSDQEDETGRASLPATDKSQRTNVEGGATHETG